MENSKNLEIALATADDIPTILKFIQELAEFEKLENEVVASEDQIYATLFAEKPCAQVLLARWQNIEVGFALFFESYSTFLARSGIYLEDLFVLPEYRSRGIGKRLLKSLAQLAVEKKAGRLEWSVLNWNKAAIDFYQSLGAKAMNEWTVYRLSGKELTQLADS